MKKKNRALFLDRDGVLNKLVNNRPPWNIDEIEIYAESKMIIEIAKRNKYIPIVITNQPDAARGYLSFKDLHEINKQICNRLSIPKYYICPHGYDNMCECRKPKPGMLLRAVKDYNLNISESFLIGDREKDILAGKNAGCKTIFINKQKLGIANYCVYNHQELIKIISSLLSKL